ncbi:hypothetical protein [uncultured Mameliella sp.]|uniref:hypothetical protein n=1 Tax=uncultured Mameliella sp. TaxID=1447087 RepID=UPI00260A15B5|nr:hypothetical protein [uncultured Mameliella sp.]
MARVNELTEREITRPSLHKAVEATYSVFEVSGEKVLQLDSYGSPNRALPGKVSQSLQLDEKAAKQLFEILRQDFGY